MKENTVELLITNTSDKSERYRLFEQRQCNDDNFGLKDYLLLDIVLNGHNADYPNLLALTEFGKNEGPLVISDARIINILGANELEKSGCKWLPSENAACIGLVEILHEKLIGDHGIEIEIPAKSKIVLHLTIKYHRDELLAASMPGLTTEEVKNLVFALSHSYVSSYGSENEGLLMMRKLWYKFRDELKLRLQVEEYEEYIAVVKKMMVEISQMSGSEMDKLINREVIAPFQDGAAKIKTE